MERDDSRERQTEGHEGCAEVSQQPQRQGRKIAKERSPFSCDGRVLPLIYGNSRGDQLQHGTIELLGGLASFALSR